VKMSKLGYFSEFFLFPLLVGIAASCAYREKAVPDPVILTLTFLIAVFGWTFVEYLLHRVLFHHAPILSLVHEKHHDTPRELIGTPSWASGLIAMVAVAAPLIATFGLDLGTAATAGMMTGYLWYVFVHYASHHWHPRKGSYLYRARTRHARHHQNPEAGNFGVTTILWDHIFGTKLSGVASRAVTTA